MTDQELEVIDLIGHECLRRNQDVDLTTIHVHQSVLATRVIGPKVQHRKRWWHTVMYHDRQQRRLNAEHGMERKPSLYLIDPSKITDVRPTGASQFAGQKPYFLVHPDLWPVLNHIITKARQAQAQAKSQPLKEKLMPIPLERYLSMDDPSFDYQYVDHKIQPGQVFAHYKAGDYYKVITLSQCEADGHCEVVYRNIHGRVFNRPLTEWVEEIRVRELLHVPRFVLRADVKFPLAADRFWVLAALDAVQNGA
jgi:hypothetical protein